MTGRLILAEVVLLVVALALALYDLKSDHRGMHWWPYVFAGLAVASGEVRRFLERRQRRKAAAEKTT